MILQPSTFHFPFLRFASQLEWQVLLGAVEFTLHTDVGALRSWIALDGLDKADLGPLHTSEWGFHLSPVQDHWVPVWALLQGCVPLLSFLENGMDCLTWPCCWLLLCHCLMITGLLTRPCAVIPLPCPALPWVSGTAPFRRRTGSLARLTWSYPWPCCTLVMSCIHPIKLMFGVARAFGVAVCVYCKAAELWGDGEDAAPTRTWFSQTLLLLNPLHVALAMCGLWQAGNFSLCAVFWKPV